MSTRQDTARLLFGGIESATRSTMALGSSSVRRGTAQSDSSGGMVSVLLDGSTQAVDLRCILPVKKGQRGTIVYQGGTYTFIALEQLTEDTKSNSKAIEDAEAALKEAQDDLKELDVKLYGEDGKSGKMAELNTKLADLDTALHGEGGLDEKLSGLDDDLSNLNTELYGDGTEKNPGKLAELDADLDPDNEKGAMGKAVAEAKAALADAKTAQETADGKNKVFVQKATPSSDGLKQGDLWRKLDGDDNITGEYVWNGSAWAKHVLTADALLVKSIVAATAFIQALQANKLTANEVDAASIVTRSLLTSLLKANKITANEIGSGAVTTNHLGAKAVTAAKVDVEELVASEAFIGQFAANTAIIEQIYAAAVVAKEITASKLKVAGDDSYAEVANGVLTLYNSAKDELSTFSASLASLCLGKLNIGAGSTNSYINAIGAGRQLTFSAEGGVKVGGAFASMGGSALLPSTGNLDLTSSEQAIPFTWTRGQSVQMSGTGVLGTDGNSRDTVSGFALFEDVAGQRCALAIYQINGDNTETQLAQAITYSPGAFCTVSIGPVAGTASRYVLRARTGNGGGFIGGGSAAHTKAALTVWT